MRTLTLTRCASILLIPVVVALSGCEKNNLFGKLRNDGGDAKTLTAQAGFALQNKNYSEALELAQRALAQDPNNSKAAYFAAVANMGVAGFNTGVIVSNVIGSQSVKGFSMKATDLGEAIQLSRESLSVNSTCGGANSIMRDLDCTSISNRINYSICLYQRIASGLTTGEIKSTDSGLLINYAFLKILRAVVRSIIAGFIDVLNVSKVYSVQTASNVSTVCSTDPALVVQVAKDLTGAYAILNRLVNILGLSDTALVSKVRDDISKIGTDLLTRGASEILPSTCYDVLSNAGITSSNFTTQTDAFDPPSSPC